MLVARCAHSRGGQHAVVRRPYGAAADAGERYHCIRCHRFVAFSDDENVWRHLDREVERGCVALEAFTSVPVPAQEHLVAVDTAARRHLRRFGFPDNPSRHLCISGIPGAGKTTELAELIVDLAVAGQRVLAIYFNKGMKEEAAQRIEHLFRQKGALVPRESMRRVEVRTLDSLCHEMTTARNVEEVDAEEEAQMLTDDQLAALSLGLTMEQACHPLVQEREDVKEFAQTLYVVANFNPRRRNFVPCSKHEAAWAWLYSDSGIPYLPRTHVGRRLLTFNHGLATRTTSGANHPLYDIADVIVFDEAQDLPMSTLTHMIKCCLQRHGAEKTPKLLVLGDSRQCIFSFRNFPAKRCHQCLPRADRSWFDPEGWFPVACTQQLTMTWRLPQSVADYVSTLFRIGLQSARAPSEGRRSMFARDGVDHALSASESVEYIRSTDVACVADLWLFRQWMHLLERYESLYRSGALVHVYPKHPDSLLAWATSPARMAKYLEQLKSTPVVTNQAQLDALVAEEPVVRRVNAWIARTNEAKARCRVSSAASLAGQVLDGEEVQLFDLVFQEKGSEARRVRVTDALWRGMRDDPSLMFVAVTRSLERMYVEAITFSTGARVVPAASVASSASVAAGAAATAAAAAADAAAADAPVAAAAARVHRPAVHTTASERQRIRR